MAAKTKRFSTLIETQLPSFISDEYENFSKFIEKYYEQLESPGQPLDIINNITSYADINYYEKNLLKESTVLTENLTEDDTSISVEDASSFPKENGYIGINDEICFYKTRTDTEFLEVSRGVSGNTRLGDLYDSTEFVTTNAAEHTIGASVANISNLFLYALVKNFESQYLAAFPEKYLKKAIDKRTLIKNIKSFYEAKGTESSIQFVFNAVIPENEGNVPTTYNPTDYTLKPSTSNWITKYSLKVSVLSGDIESLIGKRITQNQPKYASAIVDNVIFVGEILGESIYELVLAPETVNSTFDVVAKTKLAKSLSSSASVGDRIDVISAFGWGNKGQLLIGNEKFTFDDKNVNQFVIESRSGSTSYSAGTDVYEYNTIQSDGVSFIVLGILYNLNVSSPAPYSLKNDKVEISKPGFITTDPKIFDASNNQIRWKLNTLRTAPLVLNNPTLQSKISNLVSDVSAIYEDDQYYYICSSGYPSHSILNAFVTDNIGDQKGLKLIRKNPTTVTEVYPTTRRDVGIFVDGTIAVSYKDFDSVNFGKITKINVTNRGSGYKTAPYVLVNNEQDKAEAVMLGEVVESIKINTSDIYQTPPEITVTSGRNAQVSAIVTEGRVTSLVIDNAGEYYSSAPTIIISDRAGRGRFAEYKAIVSFDGKIIDFEKIDEGKFYTQGNINVEVVPAGRGATATSEIYEWVKNRFASLEAILDDDYGCVFPNYDENKLPGYARVANPLRLRASVNDNLSQSLIEPQTKTHSPILGFAYDGNPIYGPFGFSDPTDIDSSIVRLSSGYTLNNTRENGPSVIDYPLGTFIDDYTWRPSVDKTILDKNNGRFCVTPEYPEGTYAYFITTASDNTPVFPYILGENYYSLPVDSNYNSDISQNDLPKNVKRLYTEDLEQNGSEVIAFINDVTTGSIDGVDVVSSPKSFSVGSKLVFDNTGAGGSGVSGFVSSVVGENVTEINSKNTIVKIDTIQNGYFFDRDIIVQENTNARGTVVGNLFNENFIVLENVTGTFDNTNSVSAKDSNDNIIQVLNLILNQNSSYTKDSEVELTDGLNNQDSVIATGIILESTSNQNSLKIKVTSGEFIVDENYQLKSSNLNDTPGSNILALASLSQNLTPFNVDSDLALAVTDQNHNLAIGDKVNIDIKPDDNTTETLYFVRKRKYQYINLANISYSAKLIDTGIGRIENLNSGIGYISGTFTDVELVFLDQSKSRNNVGEIGDENNAIADITVVNGKITSVEITSKGKNYRRGDILTVLDNRLYQQVGTLKAAFLVDHVGISNTETLLQLTTAAKLSTGDKIKIGDEIIEISSVDLANNQVTVIRGSDNTVAADHFNGQDVLAHRIVYNFNSNDRPLGESSNDPFVYSFDQKTNNLVLNYSYGINNAVSVLNSNVFYDNSTPRKLVSIRNVSEVQDKLEFAKDTETVFEINPVIEVQKFYSYKFDTSHFSMTNTFLDFSPSLNENIIVEEKEASDQIPGSSGSFVKIKLGFGPLIKSNDFVNKKDLKFDNYYYFIVANDVNTDGAYLKTISDPLSGEKQIVYSTTDKFVYGVNKEPQYQGSGVITYTTTSRFATGIINSVFIDNSGNSYTTVPTVTGVYVSPTKECVLEPIYDSVSGIIESVRVVSGGRDYIDPIVVVSNYSNDNSKFKIYSENGVIKRVDILKSSAGYTYLPELKVIEGAVTLYTKSNNIGIPKNVKFINNGAGFYNDNSVLSSYTSSYALILKDFNSDSFFDGEDVVQEVVINNIKVETFRAKVCFNGWRVGSNILRLRNITGSIDKNLPIKGKAGNTVANISDILYTQFSTDVRSYFDNQGYYSSDRGKLSSNTQKLTDSYFYQDYSYVIKSKTAIDIWRDLIKQTTHPAGYQLFGEMLVETAANITVPTQQPSSSRVRIINLATKSVEVIDTKRTITETVIKVENTNIQRGIGYVSIDEFNNSETIATKLKLSPDFNGTYDFKTGKIIGKQTFTLIDAKSNLPINLTSNQQVIIALDGVIQEPERSYKISGSQITFKEPPLGKRIVEGQLIPAQEFIGTSFKFKTANLNEQYLKKIRNIFQRDGIWLDSANQIRFNKAFIIDEALGYAKEKYSEIPWTNFEQYFRNDCSYIIDSIEHDLRFGGNIKTLSYKNLYSRQIANYFDELKDVSGYILNLCVAAIRNWDITFVNDGLNNEVIISSDSDIVTVPSTKGIVVGMYISSGDQFPENTKVIEVISDTQVRLSNQAFPDIGLSYEPLTISEISTYTVPSGTEEEWGVISVSGVLQVNLNAVISSVATIASVRQITFYLSKINTGTFYDAANLIEKNRSYIQEETIGWLANEYPTFNNPSPDRCQRDIGYFIDAVVYHLKYGGNKKLIEFGQAYYENNRLKHITDQLPESISAYSYAKDLMINAMRNDLVAGVYTNIEPFIDEEVLNDSELPKCQEVASTINSYFGVIETILSQGRNLVRLSPENEQRSGNWTSLKTYSNYDIIQYTPIFNSECQEVVSSLVSLFGVLESAINGEDVVISTPDFFDGETNKFDLYYEDGNIVKTDENENLLVALNGVLQIPYQVGQRERSYYIERSSNPNTTDRIVFSRAPEWDQNEGALLTQEATAVERFFAYSIGNYQTFTVDRNIIPYTPQGPFQILSTTTNKVTNVEDSSYVLVFVDGVLQKPNISYTITSSAITFTSDLNYFVSESGEEIYPNVDIIVLYGRDLEKTATFYDFEPDVYFQEVILRVNGSEAFNEFSEWFNNNKHLVDLVAYQRVNGIINNLGKIKGYKILDEFANTWEIVLLGHNPLYDSELPFYLSSNNRFELGTDLAEISDALVVFPNQVYIVPVDTTQVYGTVLVQETGIIEVRGTLVSSTSSILYNTDTESTGILKRDMSIGLYDTEAGNKAWRVRASNYANLLEGDSIQIDGENAYRDILDVPDTARTKQFNIGEYVSNSLYAPVKVTNYNDITRGEGLSVSASIDNNGSVSKLNWNRRDLNLYFNNKLLLQPTAYQYYTPPVLQFIPVDGNGGGAKAEVIAIGGQIIDIVLIDGGYGYTEPPRIVISRGYNRIKKSGRKFDSLSIVKISPEVIDSYSTLRVTYEVNITAETPEIKIITSNVIVSPLNISAEIFRAPYLIRSIIEINDINALRDITRILTPGINVNSISNVSKQICRNIETRSDVTSICTVENTDREIVSSLQTTITGAITEYALPTVNDRGAFLDIGLSETDDIVYIPNTFGFPDTGRLLIGGEIVFYSSKFTDRFVNVLRGQYGTNATTHEAGDYLRLIADTISVVPTKVVEIYSESLVTETHTTTSAIYTSRSTTVNQVQSFDTRKDAVEITNELEIEINPTVSNVREEIVTICLPSYENIILNYNTHTESKIEANSIESLTSSVVTIASSNTIVENIVRIDVNTSDTLISTQITAKYANAIESIIQSKFELTHNQTQTLSVEQIDINSSIVSSSAIINLITAGVEYSSSFAINTVQSVSEELISYLPVQTNTITATHQTHSEISVDTNSIDSISSSIVTFASTLSNIITSIDSGFIDQPGTSDKYEIHALGNTVGTYDVFKFDDTGVSNVSEVTLGMFDIYYPFITIEDFDERKYSNFTLSGDKFNATYLSVNEYGAVLSQDITNISNEIFVESTGGFPNSGYLYVGNEIVFYGGKTLNSFTNVQRGVRNTLAQSHSTYDYIRSLN